MKEKTICAISTALGNSAISIIRISGNKSLDIAKKYFFKENLDYKNILPRKMYLGNFISGDINEKCFLVYFKTPLSYTGEDMVEFQIHGGEFLTKKILSIISKHCELASPGEFTRRAFFNGKISLSEAEGIIDLINAESDSELKSAYKLSSGKFNKEIINFQNKLKELLAKIEVSLDYPEHDEDLITIKEANFVLKNIDEEIKNIFDNSQNGEILKAGVNVAIMGSPNVGKSSLLNSILGKDRAIVSSIAGTTRDTISETIIYNGVKFNFTDTAGIRNSINEIEKIGIEKAKKEIKSADLVLLVFDLSREMLDDEKEMFNMVNKNKTIVVFNKKDIAKERSLEGWDIVNISAKNEENINNLLQKIYEKTIKTKIDLSKVVLTNLRHVNILKNVEQIIKRVLKNIDTLTLDIVAFEVKRVWNELGKITGESENEEIINEIFSKFCLGK